MADIKKAAEALKRHGFDAVTFDTKEEASEYLSKEVKGKVVAFGGSVSLKEMGLFETLSKDNLVLWHWVQPGPTVFKAARQAEVYITSANGLAETGEIVNIEGTGNRLAQTIFGPEALYYVVGANKVSETLEGAMHRAKNVVSPKNAQRLKADTPCAKNADKCYDCDSPGRICRVTAVTDRKPRGIPKVEVILVGETLGY